MQQKRRGENDDPQKSFSAFDQHHCIFVHIPKCAGVSVSTGLFGIPGGFHASVKKFQIIYEQEAFDTYFKFTFVRNPWDRLFSAYRFLLKGGMYERDRIWAQDNIARFNDFDDFVLNWVRPERLDEHVVFKPQHSFLTVPWRSGVRVDFVGYYENIDDDFESIRQTLGLPDNRRLARENLTGPGIQSSAYLKAYSDAARARVADVYRRDIELFGYSYDNQGLADVLSERSPARRPLLSG